MDNFTRLAQQRPLVFVHLLCALGALALGALVLARRKGTPSHRALGWSWVLLMGAATLTSAFIRDHGMPNIGGVTPIHFFTAYVGLALPRAVLQARAGRIAAHRQTMRGIYIGGCVIAGLFTLLPSRWLGGLLWRALGVVG
jgi:uncharacterized membrane protein